jgi:DNA helicase II / ATP-dependent DNA helicase PcrA
MSSMDAFRLTSAPALWKEIEEERRLLYVAMTRAKDQLNLIVPQRFFTHQQRPNGDRHVYASRTRFIPAAILRHFGCCTWPSARPSPGGETASLRETVNIGAKLRRMWG